MSKLFDDASLAMIPSAYSDGRLYSVRPVPEFGSELLTQPVDLTTDFSINTVGTVIVDADTFTTSGGTFDGIRKLSLLTVGKKYRLVIEGDTTSSGFTLGSNAASGNEYGIGFGTHYFTAVINSNLWVRQQGAGTTNITTFSIKEVSNIGDFDFSRGSNLAATRVDVNGLIEKGRENLATYSNNFAVSAWYKNSGCSVSLTRVTDPFGVVDNAWQIIYDGTDNGRLEQDIGASGIKTMSCWLRVASGTQSAQIGFSGSDLLDITITNTWTRFEYYSTLGTYPRIRCNDAATIEVYGFQAELGLVATDYIETGASTAQAGILEDMPRLDYSGGASCPALLLEPQRTNIVAQSEYILAASGAWYPNALTITHNYGTSPEGLNNSTRLVLDNLTSSRIAYIPTLTDGTTYTFSCWYKGTAGEKLYMEGNGSGGSGTFTSKLITLTGDWQREDLQFVGGSSTNLIYIVDSRNGSEDTATDFEVYGAQLEIGSYPTSYIPTYGSSVTRSQEITSNTYNTSSEGTIFVELGEQREPYFSVLGEFFEVAQGDNKIAIVYTPTSLKISHNGSIVVNSTGTYDTSSLSAIQLGHSNGSDILGGIIKQFTTFSTLLTDTEINALTV